MWISEIAERAIMGAMSAITVTMHGDAGVAITFRASRVDNETDLDTERKIYPCMVIQAGGGNKETIESLFSEVPITVTIITHYDDDPKCTTLAEMEDKFRKILDKPVATSTVKTAFDAAAVAGGETRYFKGLTAIDGGMVEVTEKEQRITTTMIMHVCGS